MDQCKAEKEEVKIEKNECLKEIEEVKQEKCWKRLMK